YYDLVSSEDIVNYSLYDAEREQILSDLLSQQQLAIWTGKPMASHLLTSRFGVQALPYGPGQATVIQSDAYFISAASNHQQAGACWRWIRYLSLQRTDSEQIPARISLLTSEAFVRQYGQRQTDAIIAA